MNIKNIKHNKIKVAAVIFAILFSLIFALPVSALKTNIALECKIDSFCCEKDGAFAYMMVDRDINYETKWETSGGAGHTGEHHWIILDFETERIFDAVRLTKASQGMADFGKTELNAGGFSFEISSDKIKWMKILEVTDNGYEDIYEGSFLPVSARYLKLTITQPERNESAGGNNQTVRLYDLKVFEYNAPFDYEDNDFEETIEETSVPKAAFPAPDTSDAVLELSLLFLSEIFAAILIFSKNKKNTVRINIYNE